MGTERKNVIGEEAIEKIQKIAEGTDICLFATALDTIPLTARPMSTQKVDDNGSIWFFSKKGSEKNVEIEKDQRVQLFYANRNNSEFLSVYGTASITQDAAKAKELWTPLAKVWFNEGPEDPLLTIIEVTPEEGYYWDAKDGKIITLMKMAVGAITGKEIDGSRQGKVTV